MLGIGKTRMSLNALWGDKMQQIILKAEILKPLQQQLRQALDVAGDEYDAPILQAIQEAFGFCRKLVPNYAGLETSLNIAIKPLCAWYDVPIDTMAQISGVVLKPAGCALQALHIDEFLGLRREPGNRPYYYTYFSGQLGIKPLFAGNDMSVVVNYVGYSAEQFFDQAFDLIKARALFDLYQNFLNNPQSAQAALRNYSEQLALFQTQQSRSSGLGRIVATNF